MDGGFAGAATGRDGEGRDGESRDAGERSPLLDLDGFTGRLGRLLDLARARRIDLAALSLPAVVEQLAAALQDASGRTPLGQRGDWVVMAAWLLLLRSRLLLPADAATREAAGTEAARLRQGLVALGEAQAAARWLDARPQLGRQVFARGQPEFFGTETATAHQVDVIEFLWASLALFDDDLPGPDTAASYRPVRLDLHAVAEASERILLRVQAHPAPRLLDELLPERPAPGAAPESALRGRSRWTSTFAASLELARQGDVALDQDGPFGPILVRLPTGASSG